ncbi:hypothetical protein ACFQX6_53190 [Streptosporangium lutulentum]
MSFDPVVRLAGVPRAHGDGHRAAPAGLLLTRESRRAARPGPGGLPSRRRDHRHPPGEWPTSGRHVFMGPGPRDGRTA